ncbi:hypothetical protein ACWOFR_01110 [Carnobacterium gallinarum]|uniref:hypothetical protein n=1 Tax=Carnobacterium gallinarum TaxID=2749 RepID=UPI00055941FA|nr:hypothetical protein [Carnobacterium gallinarum]
MTKSSRVLNEDYLDVEDELKRLKQANRSIETAYSSFQSFSRREKELWDKIGQLSVGTEAERSVLREFDYLEEESHFFNGKLTEGEDELKQELSWKIKQRDQLEEAIFDARKEETKCHE